jgi:chorismate mutase
LFTLIDVNRCQLVVQKLEPNKFGHSELPTPSRATGDSAPKFDWKAAAAESRPQAQHWKRAVARVATGLDADKGGNSYQEHKQQQALDGQIEDLRHAQAAIQYLEERAANKLKADIDEVDHMIVRRHRLTDRSADNDKDIATIEKHITALRTVSSNLLRGGNAEEEKAVNHEVSDLTFAAASLRGREGEVLELSHEIEATTADGRKMDKQLQHLSKERVAIGRQVRVLKQSGDELLDSEETARDFEAFERKGYEAAADEDDPYIREAAAALEKASGWNKDDLDAEAVKRREIMTKGLSGNPGQAVQALKALGR